MGRRANKANNSKRKQLQGARGIPKHLAATDVIDSSESDSLYHDLNVPTSKDLQTSVLARLADTGYAVVAISHTVKGRPSPDAFSDKTIPLSFGNDGKPSGTKRKRSPSSPQQLSTTMGAVVGQGAMFPGSRMRVWKRLNVIVEDLVHVGYFVAGAHNGNCSDPTTDADDVGDVLRSYDLVALVPKNDASFQAACATATLADIVVLDYWTNTTRKPYRIRTADLQALKNRGGTLELNYSPSLTGDTTRRKALLECAKDLHLAWMGVVQRTKLNVILSSGPRSLSKQQKSPDLGPMVLRTPGDLMNVIKVLLGFSASSSRNALTTCPTFAMTRGQDRQCGISFQTPSKVSNTMPLKVTITSEAPSKTMHDSSELTDKKPSPGDLIRMALKMRQGEAEKIVVAEQDSDDENDNDEEAFIKM
jgi:RNase P/RNase MRP subunit p30